MAKRDWTKRSRQKRPRTFHLRGARMFASILARERKEDGGKDQDQERLV
jgi:hypothetical protein